MQDELRALLEQQAELGQRIVALAERAGAEIEDLKIQVQTCATEFGEARVELAELRAAHGIEMRERATAEARVVKLGAKIAKIRAACADLDEEDAASPDMEAPAETGVEPTAPWADAVVDSLGADRDRSRGDRHAGPSRRGAEPERDAPDARSPRARRRRIAGQRSRCERHRPRREVADCLVLILVRLSP
jgi:hypothetical protein